jgi:hypothetical protein
MTKTEKHVGVSPTVAVKKNTEKHFLVLIKDPRKSLVISDRHHQ